MHSKTTGANNISINVFRTKRTTHSRTLYFLVVRTPEVAANANVAFQFLTTRRNRTPKTVRVIKFRVDTNTLINYVLSTSSACLTKQVQKVLSTVDVFISSQHFSTSQRNFAMKAKNTFPMEDLGAQTHFFVLFSHWLLAVSTFSR